MTVPEAADRPVRIAVVGGGTVSATDAEVARAVGRALAAAGAVLVCGGLGGVMAAAARGCREAGGLTLGLLPGDDPSAANPWVAVPVATGMGEARNVLVVRAGEAVIAVGGAWGTLSEIALARKLGRPVATLGRVPAEGLGLPAMASPEEAVERVLRWVREARERRR